MRRGLGITCVAGGAAAVLVLSLALVANWAAKHEPRFYQEALRVEAAFQAEAGDELEQGVLQLHNDTRQPGRWEAVFTDEQINGWLASDMPEKFPDVLPGGLAEPRAAIDGDVARVACRYEQGRVKTVISLALEVGLTQETNTLAVRICAVRAGALPVPLEHFLDQITAAAHNGNIPLRWSQTDGDPVALVTIPGRHEDYAHYGIYLETIELRDGEVYLAGRTEVAGEPSLAGGNSTVQR